MNNHITSSVIAGGLALAVLTTALPAPSAYAQNNTDVDAQIAALIAQIKVLQAQLAAQNTTPSITLTRNLSQGMSGADVKALQQFLNSNPATLVANTGAGSKGNETQYFGPATRAAVIKFQELYHNEVLSPVGLSNGTGYVGASTRAKIAQLASQNPGNQHDDDDEDDNSNDDDVSEEGDITVTRTSERTDTLELSGGFDPIYGIEIEAEDSKMTITRMDFMFDKQPWRYLDSLELHHEGKKVAEIAAKESAFTKVGNEYRLRFANLKEVVQKGDEHEFVLHAKALNNLSSSRAADTLSVYLPEQGIRAVDTANVTTQQPGSTLDARTFDFRDAEGDGEITVTLENSSPDSGVLQVKTNSNTTNTTVLVADIKAEDSDIAVKDIYVKVASSESTVSNVVRNLTLYFDGKSIAKENVVKNTGSAITGTDEDGNSYTIIAANEYYVHFEDLDDDIEIDEDDREAVTFKAEFHKQNGRYSNGTDVTFTLRAVEGENANGEDIVHGDLSTGGNRTFALYTDGLSFSFKSEDADTTGQQSRIGSFTLTFDVTAFGSDIYIPTNIDRQTGTTTPNTDGAVYSVKSSGSTRYALGNTSATIDVKGAKETNGYFRLTQGSSYQVTMQVSLDNAGATTGFYRTQLEAFRFKVGSTSGIEHTLTTGFSDFVTDTSSVQS